MASKTNFISRAQQLAQQQIEVGDQIASLIKEYNDLGSGDAFADADFEAARGDPFNKAAFITGIATFQQVDQLLGSGHRVNLRKVAG